MRLAIVTGGSKGLGLALCRALEDRGYAIREFSRSAPHSYSTSLDLSDPLASQRSIADALHPLTQRSWEEILVFNNAATLDPMGPVSGAEPEEVFANLQINVTAPVLALGTIIKGFQNAACPKLIGNISSGVATHCYSGWSLYCAAKAGMEHFIRALALEQSDQRWPFRAININPGVIDTDMQAQIRESSAEDFPAVERFIRRKEEGELADPGDVAESVLRIVAADVESGERYSVADFAA